MLYWFPARRLTVIAVTGTDGKTTTVGMIHHILVSSGRKAASASTAFLQIMDRRETNETHLTSLSPFVLQRFLRRALRAGCEYAVIEASSHGLVQGRLNHAYPAVAVVTNTTPEHLDYHGTMEQYRKDKGILFEMLGGRGVKVLNMNDGSLKTYRSIASEKTILWSGVDRHAKMPAEGADLWISSTYSNGMSVGATLNTKSHGVAALRLNMPGVFNLDNAVCAVACATAIGVPLAGSVGALASFKPLPGRLERIDEGQDFHVFVDFAVSARSYEQTLSTLRSIVGKDARVIVLCGSCGNRMREKRPQIGKIASDLADVVVVTKDETYGEDPVSVLDEVWSGVDEKKSDNYRIPDRARGIKFALMQARPGDAVVFCGMGPFATMATLEGMVEWDERTIVRNILNEMGFDACVGGHS